MNTLKAPETKLVTTEKLLAQGKYRFAVQKWSLACGEILEYTTRESTAEIKAEIDRLFAWSHRLGHDLFKHMKFLKKLKYAAYLIVYRVFRLVFKRKIIT